MATAEDMLPCDICGELINAEIYSIHILSCAGLTSLVPLATSRSMLLRLSPLLQELDYETNMMIAESVGNVEIGLTPEIIAETSRVVAKTETESVETCPICLETFDAFARRLMCSHEFCDACILKWLSRHKWCPCCKIDLEESRPKNLIPTSSQPEIEQEQPT